jgi:iron complex transport system ATP-binding protein
MTLSLNNVTYRAGKAVLLEDLSLSIEPGVVTVIMGPNGAGKSTAFAMLAGDLSPSAGRAFLDDRLLSGYSANTLARRRVVLTQGQSIEFPMTVYEIVALGLVAGMWTKRDSLAAIGDSLAAADVIDLAERSYMTLSGGEKQRVRFARALAQLWRPPGREQELGKTRYFLLDEPTSSLDLKHQIMLLEHCRCLANAGVGVGCILHDPALAKQYADMAVMIVGGRARHSGAADEIFKPAIVAEVFDISERHADAVLGAPGNQD